MKKRWFCTCKHENSVVLHEVKIKNDEQCEKCGCYAISLILDKSGRIDIKQNREVLAVYELPEKYKT
jgi:hypothetical protein